MEIRLRSRGGGHAVVLGPPVNCSQAMFDRLDLGFSEDIMADRCDRWPILVSVHHERDGQTLGRLDATMRELTPPH
jgi:hypothetical protein